MAQIKQPKKMLIVNIIDILNRYTDSQHTLTQRQIEQILEDEYLMDVDRKTVRRNLADLIDCDAIELEYTEKPRLTKKMVKNEKTGEMKATGEVEESSVFTDFAIVRDFTEGELRYLIDGVFASNHIPAKHRKDLIKKIEKLGGRYFKAHAGNIERETSSAVYSQQLFYTVGMLDEAIQQHKKVKFHYKWFGVDKKASYRVDEEGNRKEYIVSPYEMVSKNGQYYLICNDGTHEGLVNYRVDRIADIDILDDRARPLKDFASKADMDRYLHDHIYMYAGKSVRSKFRLRRRLIAYVVDIFGEDFNISDTDDDETDGWVTVTATVDSDSLVIFAKSYSPDVVVLSPKSVVDRIKRELAETLQSYE